MASAILKQFQSRLKGVEYTRKRMERLFRQGHATRRDVETVYEAVFLRGLTAFEQFCEGLFLAILDRKMKHSSNLVSPLIQCSSAKALRKILLRRSAYMTWLPYSDTIERAKLFLEDGLPFTSLETDDTKDIQIIVKVRNAIAHRSKHALKVFKKEVIDIDQSLLPRERSPAGYLRSNLGKDRTRCQHFMSRLLEISEHLWG